METICAIKKHFSHYTKHFSVVVFLLLMNVMAFAQRGTPAYDNHVTTEFNYDVRETPWYAQPWIWAIVASVLILFIAYASQGYLKRHRDDHSETGTAH